MQTTWKNLYKVNGIFLCPHRQHKHSEKGTSVWHILKNKKCYPDGCISFLWKCRKFDQRRKCHRDKKHVGRECFSCKFFYEEKLMFQPEVKISQDKFAEFQEQLVEFEDWLELLKGKRIEVRGTIDRILPLLVNNSYDRRLRIECRGILFYFRSGIFGYDRFDDPFYARLSFKTYERYKLSVGDEIDMLAELRIDRGRFVFWKTGSIEVVRPGNGEQVPLNSLQQAKFTGSLIDGQPAKCLTCINGLMIDNIKADGRKEPRRLVYCLRGVADYHYCPYREI